MAVAPVNVTPNCLACPDLFIAGDNLACVNLRSREAWPWKAPWSGHPGNLPRSHDHAHTGCLRLLSQEKRVTFRIVS